MTKTSPATEVPGPTDAAKGPDPERGPISRQLDSRADEPDRRSEEFDADVSEIRRLYGSGTLDLVSRLAELIRRRLVADPLGTGSAIVSGLTGAGIRLLTVVLVAVVFGQWGIIPWARWAVIVGLYGLIEAGWRLGSPPPDVVPSPRLARVVEDWTALFPRIARESDVRELADFTRRWLRPQATMAAGLAVASTVLLACVLFVPAGLSELPAGSIVLLAWLLYDFGATPVYWGTLFQWALMAKESRYDHHLFWPSPADSPEVRKAMRKPAIQGFAAGWWMTVFLAMTVILVSWDSPLVVTLAAGFILIGYVSTLGTVFGSRASVHRIIERSRDQRLAVLRPRIDAFEPRLANLSPQESAQLRDLLFLHDKIRDAPTTPTRDRTLVRTAAGLILPTVVFVVTVFGEVSAERILDALLP